MRHEPERGVFLAALAAHDVSMSAVTYFELGIVTDSVRDAVTSAEVDGWIADFDIAVVPVTHEQARLARAAYARFGKGNHPARLNFGDCFTYALAKATNEPLLFKGNDFSQTDIQAAV